MLPPLNRRESTILNKEGNVHVPDVWMYALQDLRETNRKQSLLRVQETGKRMHLQVGLREKASLPARESGGQRHAGADSPKKSRVH
jgi:hypothetical protein